VVCAPTLMITTTLIRSHPGSEFEKIAKSVQESDFRRGGDHTGIVLLETTPKSGKNQCYRLTTSGSVHTEVENFFQIWVPMW